MKTLYNKAKNDQWEESDVVMAIIARFGTGGGNTPIVIEYEGDSSGSIQPCDSGGCNTDAVPFQTRSTSPPVCVD